MAKGLKYKKYYRITANSDRGTVSVSHEAPAEVDYITLQWSNVSPAHKVDLYNDGRVVVDGKEVR